PDQFQCAPGERCFPRDWLCDGHPDCLDEEDEQDCGTATPAEPSPEGPALSPSEPAALESVCLPNRGSEWVSACAFSSPGLLSILVAAGSVAVWGLFKAKSRSNAISLEKASREQLMSDKSQ
ncbi:RSVR protein, partial [Oxyruncus cristatus]|nr:RSVR protein [Oxyruncus cristatus]